LVKANTFTGGKLDHGKYFHRGKLGHGKYIQQVYSLE